MSSDQHWVLAWRPFDPAGMFVHEIGDLSQGENAIKAKHGLAHAKRMTKGEAQYLLQAIKKAPGLTFWRELVLVSIGDHLFSDPFGSLYSED